VNAIAPGFHRHGNEHTIWNEPQRQKIARRSALKRMADPIDVARSVEFLLGDGGRNVTGTTLDRRTPGIRRNQNRQASSGGSCGAIWRQWKRSAFAAKSAPG